MSSQEYIRSVTEILSDDMPTLTPLNESGASNNSFMNYISSITWQTWIIIVLILAFLGINIFAYLAKGTQVTANLFETIFAPLLKLFGYSTLSTTKQTIETSATGTKAGVDIVAGATTGAIDTLQNTAINSNAINSNAINSSNTVPSTYKPTSGTSVGTSINSSNNLPVQNDIQQIGANAEQWNQDTLQKALDNARQIATEINPDDSRSSIQTTGKAGWCYIGDDQGIRTCAEVGVDDLCMSGDIFPTQAVCMNPNLRA